MNYKSKYKLLSKFVKQFLLLAKRYSVSFKLKKIGVKENIKQLIYILS